MFWVLIGLNVLIIAVIVWWAIKDQRDKDYELKMHLLRKDK